MLVGKIRKILESRRKINYIMKNSRMSLDAFKASAELANETIALDAIQGGNLFDCHGRAGAFGKAVVDATIRILRDYANDGKINGNGGPLF